MTRDTGWFTSSFSSSSDQACVQVRITEGRVAVRDSKNVTGPMFSFSQASWREFVTATRG